MSFSSDLCSKDWYRVTTSLRDIIDILYDGKCEILKDDELLTTIYKKMGELNNYSKRQKKYKIERIMNILNSSKNGVGDNCNINEDVVLFILDDIISLCEKIIDSDKLCGGTYE